MPWKAKNIEEQRYEFIRQWQAGGRSVSDLSREYQISRQTAYKWRRRFQHRRLAGLKDRSRRPEHQGRQTRKVWLQRLRRERQRRPTWGARKLRWSLEERFGRQGVPSSASIGRWLRRWGLTPGRKRRARGPGLARPAVRKARAANEVWTVDFKGWYRTGDGTRVDPLTVRDLYSHYSFCVRLLRRQCLKTTQREMRRLFRKHGLPERIRCDNGTPFGGGGPTGLTRLSAWWVKLGIEVEFITPGRPDENGSHEQFHGVYKREVASHPAYSVDGQQQRSNRWLRDYNCERPHEALGMQVPRRHYRKSRRAMPEEIKPWKYPTGWERRWVKGNGEISWKGSRRYVGEAFVRDYVGLKPKRRGVWWVYFGPVLVGELRENEKGSIRMARYQRQRRAGWSAALRHRSARLHSADQPKVSTM
jgi:putative transposase